MQIFLVDNAPSMAPHWNQVIHLAKVLLRRVIDYDSDGVEMYFSHGDRKVQVKQRRRQRTTDFVKAMTTAAPDSVSGPSRCNIPFALRHIFSESMKETRNKYTTIYVLTDAIWEGCNDAGVERVIKSHMQDMEWNDPGTVDLVQEQRPLSIQFIQFGHDPVGTERLRHLDDDLARDGFPYAPPHSLTTFVSDVQRDIWYLADASEQGLDRLRACSRRCPQDAAGKLGRQIRPEVKHTEQDSIVFDAFASISTIPSDLHSVHNTRRLGTFFQSAGRYLIDKR